MEHSITENWLSPAFCQTNFSFTTVCLRHWEQASALRCGKNMLQIYVSVQQIVDTCINSCICLDVFHFFITKTQFFTSSVQWANYSSCNCVTECQRTPKCGHPFSSSKLWWITKIQIWEFSLYKHWNIIIKYFGIHMSYFSYNSKVSNSVRFFKMGVDQGWPSWWSASYIQAQINDKLTIKDVIMTKFQTKMSTNFSFTKFSLWWKFVTMNFFGCEIFLLCVRKTWITNRKLVYLMASVWS